MPVNTLDWLDLQVAKDRLGITSSAQDALLTSTLAAIENAIERMIGSPVLQETRTEYYNGTGTIYLKLKARPVVLDDLQVWEDSEGFYGQADNAFSSSTELTVGEDFAINPGNDGYDETGCLIRLNGVWPVQWFRPPTRLASRVLGELGSIKVTYKAGWEQPDIPSVLMEAAYLELAAQRQGWKTGQLYSSESLNGYSYSLGNGSLNVQPYGASRLVSGQALAMLGASGLMEVPIA